MAAILGLLAGCADTYARTTVDSSPGELLVSVALGSATTLRNLKEYAEASMPGAGAAFTDQALRHRLAQAVGARSLDGFDPTYLLVADLDAAPAIALLGNVTDPNMFRASARGVPAAIKGGWAMVGPQLILDRIGAYAFGTIATQRSPTVPTATVYIPHVRARHQAEIEAFRNQLLATALQPVGGRLPGSVMAYFDGFGSILAESDKLVITLDVTSELCSLDFALTPRPSSRFAQFVALQRPTDFALFDRLPAGRPTVLMGGRIDSGPYHDDMLNMFMEQYGAMSGKSLIAAIDALRNVMTGDFAAAAPGKPGSVVEMTMLLGVSDAKTADEAFASMLDLIKAGRTIDMNGMSVTHKANRSKTAHDGVILHSFDTTYDLSKMPVAERKAMEAVSPHGPIRVQIAAFDALAMFIVAPDSLAMATRTIDAARSNAAHFVAPTLVGRLLTAARARNDSMAVMLDFGAFAAAVTGQPVAGDLFLTASFGFADRSAHIRIALPAALLHEFAS